MTSFSWLMESRLFVGNVLSLRFQISVSNVLKFVESTSQKLCRSCDYASCQIFNRFPVLF